MHIICFTAGIVCALYFIILLIYSGFTSAFYLVWPAMAVCFLLLLFGVTVSMLAAFRSSVRQVSRQEELEAERFGSYYALISEDDDTLLWNSVYEGAKAEGEENWDACVEFFGGRLVSERTTGEKLRMAIDAGVDGIILNGRRKPGGGSAGKRGQAERHSQW